MDTSYCIKENQDFTLINTSSGNGFLRKEFDSPELRKAIEDPSSLFKNAQIFKDSRTTKAGIIQLNDQEVFVKCFNNKGFGYTLKYIFRVPRPFRVWKAAWALEEAGIPTPRPIAAIAEFSGFIPKNSFLIRESVPDIIPTLDFFKIILNDNSKREQFLQTVCGLYAKMHNSGIYHGDAKCSNIYVSKKDDSFDYGIWDLLSCQLEKNAIAVKLRNKEIARFANSFAEITRRLGSSLPEDATLEKIFEIYNTNKGRNQ
jgi:tRNA A-37 threonylcarbamoyl transferase component Bud32